MKIYVHREAQQDAEALEVEASVSVGEAFGIPDRVLVVISEDHEDALDVAAALEDAVEDRAHVFAGRRPRVVASVMYNGETREREFSAAARVKRVFDWATGKHEFNLSPADAAEHALALASTGAMPADDVHLGSLDADTPGRVAFNLVPKHRFEG